jgi:hypothetical protein
MAIPMGMGQVGLPEVIFKRKFRWTLKIETACGEIPEHFVKTAARPKLEINETEINFLNGVDWIPGKAKWQPISVTYRDAGNDALVALYDWMATIYDITRPVELNMGERANYNAEAVLTMRDGCGNGMEEWRLFNVWPTNIDFGDLDYESTDIATVDLTLRYSQAVFRNLCGRDIRPCGCTGC